MRTSLPLVAALLVAPAPAQVIQEFLTVDGAPDADGPSAIVATLDGSQLVVAHRDSDALSFLDAATGAVLALVDVDADPLDVELTPDGQLALVACSGDDTLVIVDVATRTVLASVPLSIEHAYRVQPSASGAIAVVGGEGGAGSSGVAVVDLASLVELHAFSTVRQDAVWRHGIEWRLDEVGEPIAGHVRFDLSADAQRLVVPSVSERVVAVYDVASGALQAKLATSYDPAAVAITSDGARCAIWGSTFFGYIGEIQVLDLTTLTLGASVQAGFEPDPDGLVLTPDDRYAVIAGGSDFILYDLASESVAATVSSYARCGRVTLSADGGEAIAAGPDLLVVDLATLQVLGSRRYERFEHVLALPDSRAAVLRHRVAEDVTVVRTDLSALPDVWRAPSGPAPEGDGTTMLASSSDGTVVVACNVQSRDLTVFENDEIRARLPLRIVPRSVAVDDGGHVALVGGALDGVVEVVDLDAGRSRGTVPIGYNQIYALGVAPDGSTGWARTAHVLYFVDLASPPRTLSRLDVSLSYDYADALWQRRVASSPDSRLLAVPIHLDSSGHRFSIVDTHTFLEVASFDFNGSDLIVDGAFRRDGRALFVTSLGDKLRRFALEDPAPVAAGKLFLNDPEQVVVGPDDRYVYVAGNGQNSLAPHLSVVDGETMTWVTELELPARALALGAGGPYVFAALEDGTLLRFLAAGPGTALVETVDLGAVPTDLVVDPVRARVLLAHPGERDGIGILSWPSEPAPVNYCGPANPNSTGASATIEARGWMRAGERFELVAESLPPDESGIILVGDARPFLPFVPGTEGNLCVGGSTGRFVREVRSTGADGRFELAVDSGALPLAGGPTAVQPGETWCFQAFYTDRNPLPTANFTDAVGVRFP